ncbi:MAG: hypothetical protein PXX73_04630 [Sideroxydans sp.]|nr:hypothetical protein [Sideroxydans sp.]
MSDACDRADIEVERELAEALRKQAVRAARMQQPCGFCFNCDEIVAVGMRFCDGDCRDDFARLERARKNAGAA